MTNKVNGGVKGGEFLTGKMDFFAIQTLVPVAQTNATTPVADLYQISSSVWSPVTVIDGSGVAVTYATQADYEDAFKKQANFDIFLKVFSTRANPVAVSITASTVANPSAAGFGSGYTSSMMVSTINLATEKSGLWYAASQGNFGTAADETNAFGYMLTSALQGIAIDDVNGVIAGSDVIECNSATVKNTLVSRRVVL
jgi:hypothetical protein